MATDERTAVPARRRYRAALSLPVDPSDEEWARDWPLSAADKVEIQGCRGDDNRLRFALQLCVLRLYGRFLPTYDSVPLRIVNHLGRQLALPPVLLLDPVPRPATDGEYQQRLRAYLGYQPFGPDIQTTLEQQLTRHAQDGMSGEQLFTQALDLLRAWQVIPPAPPTVERLVASIAAHAQDTLFEDITAQLPLTLCQTIDRLLTVPEGTHRSPLFSLKAYPPEATPPALLTYLEREQLIRALGVGAITLRGVPPTAVARCAQLGVYYDAEDLKRFAPAKRYALVACFLIDAQKTILDYLVEMHSQYLIGMSRRARHALDKRRRARRRQAKTGRDLVLAALELMLDHTRPPETARPDLYTTMDEPTLRTAIQSCRTWQRLEDRGFVDELRARYPHLKRYLPTFLTLPFAATPGMQPLLTALDLARRLYTGDVKAVPADAPLEFVPGAWRRALWQESGQLDGRGWELALAFAVRDALRAGDLDPADSRHHVSFWNLVYDETRWQEERHQMYITLQLPSDAERALSQLHTDFAQVTAAAARGLARNPFATIVDGRLHLKRRDALEVSAQVRALRRVMDTHLPRVRIEDLLREVDTWCHFTWALRPLVGTPPLAARFYPTLLAALVAHGTNLGIALMGESTEGITVDMLHEVSHTCLRTETLTAANKALVDYPHRLALSAVWGDGRVSSSDGQRFGIEASSLLASLYPRYFGYYDRAITVYTHLSDQYSVFATRAISCVPREALYVLDGLLENDTILRPREHMTDTHGFTEHLFGLCYLLGYTFMPRLKDLTDQQLYTLDRQTSYGPLDVLFHGQADLDLLREQWDQLVRVAASLYHRTAPAHVILQRLANSTERLTKALTALGRIVKTIYILRYIHDPTLRGRIQLQLNRGEARHRLASRLFVANQGVFRTGDYEEIMNKVSCLSLLSNAVLVWNTVRMTEILAQLRAAGETIRAEDLARVSPLAYAHVIPNGTYHFDRPLAAVEEMSQALA
jgi:TnpA family transposase